ncbi:Methyl-accepting chemotaxis sensory transducer with GAF sensor [Hyella patelloides LEGE 07179]|uniref:Methyl-accepting chemotaxis sensory transducer with GAF sensor n=1 Tax=Hyella patelloides LEGE 07179 TaxID=945734 RepID=A0A563VU28_9CYAN|nr:methyl-accepting chemotaxis protein [Hyella patelloides]VEP14950.1 Methyl-accepting chemotaxis sensory transducer with GAF sensor [Hyella patelloides LEGE 07179]
MITNLLISNSSDTENQTTSPQLVADAMDSISPPKSSLKSRILSYWKKLSLQNKATTIAIAIGVVPITVVGGIAHYVASKSLMHQIVVEQESRTFEIKQKVSLFTNQLIDDSKTIANSPLLNDPQLNQATSLEQKVALLNTHIDAHPQDYDGIAVFDPEGNLLFQSKSTQPLDPKENFGDREYFQRAISTQATAVNNPSLASYPGGHNSLVVATPIKEKGTGLVLGLVRVRVPLANWQKVVQGSQLEGSEYILIDSQGKIFAANESEVIGQGAGVDFARLPQLQEKMQIDIGNGIDPANLLKTNVMLDKNDREKVVVSLGSINDVEGVLAPGWQVALSRPVDRAFAPLIRLRWILLLGTSTAALLVGSLAALLARRATLPILEAAETVQKIGQGDWNARLEVQGSDELAMLGTDINKMAKQLKSFVFQKARETKRSQLLKDLTLKLASAVDSEAVFQVAVEEIISILKVDRAIIYYQDQDADEPGKVVAEAVKSDGISRLQTTATQLEYLHEYLANDRSDRVRVVNNIYQAKLQLPHIRQLEALNVKSELSTPLFFNQKFQGFFVVQQCDRLRAWQQGEIDFFSQLASQIMLAKERTDLLLEQKTAKEQLQKRAIELLMEIEPISKGDLTIRATVADGEIGTFADSYNSTVENLRQIVTQVQKSVTQMTTTTNKNGKIAQSLSERATQQSEAIASALQQIQAMTESIQSVALHAKQVETSFQDVSDTVAVGNVGMERTVDGIFAIRETVAETGKKVKRLGESSQKISKVVNLINSFADRTNLLALNASLEANRAGQEGQNFAVVADEVQTLAQQSAEATIEIEKLVASIQLDTKEVATAMEQGTERVVAGTKLVDETRQKLNQIAASSTQLGDRLKLITVGTVQQSQVSQEISETIAEVAIMATTTSAASVEVSASTQELQDINDELQTSINRFKV